MHAVALNWALKLSIIKVGKYVVLCSKIIMTQNNQQQCQAAGRKRKREA
jgi:hypothetical protein